MTISRLWQTGFESGSDSEISYIDGGGSVISASGPYTSTYCLRHPISSHNMDVRQSFTGTKQIRGGFFLQYGVGSTGDGKPIFRIYTGGVGGTLYIEVNASASSTDMNLEVLGSKKDDYYYIPANTYFHFGYDIKIDSSNGWAYIYINGSLAMSFDGNTGSSNINIIRIGPASGATTFDLGLVIIDDIYIDDTTGEISPTAPPIKRFYGINVNGDGNYSQWTPVPTGSHYGNVDERPPNDDTDYLEAVTGSLLDSFTMTTFTLDTNEDIIAMIPYVFAKRGSTTEKLSLGTRSSGTDLIGSDQDLSTSYDYIWERQVTGSLGFDWNQSYLDSVETIINSTGTF